MTIFTPAEVPAAQAEHEAAHDAEDRARAADALAAVEAMNACWQLIHGSTDAAVNHARSALQYEATSRRAREEARR